MRLLVALMIISASASAFADGKNQIWAKSPDEKKLVAMAETAEKSGDPEFIAFVHGQLLMLGEMKYSDPVTGIQYLMLRMDPVKPNCKISQSERAKNNINEFSSPATCSDKHQFYNMIIRHLTPEVRAYRDYEVSYYNRATSTHRK